MLDNNNNNTNNYEQYHKDNKSNSVKMNKSIVIIPKYAVLKIFHHLYLT